MNFYKNPTSYINDMDDFEHLINSNVLLNQDYGFCMDHLNYTQEITSDGIEGEYVINVNNADNKKENITDNQENENCLTYSSLESPTNSSIIGTSNSNDKNSENSKGKKSKTRKLKFDGIHKKIMRNFLNVATLSKLNEILFNFFSSNVKKMKKLKQTLITKIDIISIKSLLKKSLLEIFVMDNRKHNIKIIYSTLNECSRFRDFMNQTFEQAYGHYMASTAYIADLKRIKSIEDEAYCKQYDRLAKGFIDYYKYHTKRRPFDDSN